MKNKYYVEIVDNEDGQPVLQSKWFDTKKQAKKWEWENLDFIDKEKVSSCIMTAVFNKDGGYDII